MSKFNVESPTALDYFESLVADDAHFPMLEAAIALAHDDYPQLDAQGVLAQVDSMTATLKARLPQDAGSLQKLRVLNHYFFKELGFAGNINNYYDVGNSYVHRVLETRRGIPITLAVIYLELAQAIGLLARGVSFPGHFLVKLRVSGGEAVIDPFTGRSLSRDELEERLQPFRRKQRAQHPLGMEDMEVPLGLYLQAAAPRDVLARMLHNLKEIHLTAEDWPRLLCVQDRLVRLLPMSWTERRDRGLTLGELSRFDEAINDLDVYLARCQDADDASSIRERVDDLRARRPSRLH